MTIIEEIKRPFNLITITLTIVSLALSVIFYYNGKKEIRLSYQLNEPVSKIFDSENSSSSIKLLEKDTILVTQNVYLLTGSVWNSGNLPITMDDVRQKLSIKLDSIERILDFKLIKQYDPTVSKFVLSKTGSNSIGIDWVYFDPNFGFNFQILYIGKEDPNFLLEGKILGVTSFTKEKQTHKDSFWLSISIIAMYSIVILFLSILLYVRRNDKWRRSNKVFAIMLPVLVFTIIIYIIINFMLPIDPPF